MDTSLTVAPSGPPPAPHDKSRPGKVTGRLRAAIDAMVWQGLKRAEAAQAAGLTEHALYVAFRRPHVKAHYLSECETLRTSGRARRLHRLEVLAEQDTNLNAAVAAIKAAEMLAPDVLSQHGSAAQTPGFLITIVNTSPSPAAISGHERVIEQKPNDINGSGSHQLERPTEAIGRDR